MEFTILIQVVCVFCGFGCATVTTDTQSQTRTRQFNFNTLERCAEQFDNIRQERARNYAINLQDIFNVFTDLTRNADREIAIYDALDVHMSSLALRNVLTPDDSESILNLTSQLHDVSTALSRFRSREERDTCVGSRRLSRQEKRSLRKRWLVRWRPRPVPRRFDGSHARQVRYINLCLKTICHIAGFAVLPNGDLVATDSINYQVYLYSPTGEWRKSIDLAPLSLGSVTFSHDWILHISVELFDGHRDTLVLNMIYETSYLMNSEAILSRKWDFNNTCNATDIETEPEPYVQPCANLTRYLSRTTTDRFGFLYGTTGEHVDAVAPNCTVYPSITHGRYDYMVRQIVRFEENILFVRTDSRGHRQSSSNNLHVFEMFGLIDPTVTH